jgi:small subunit ribosomal protein S30e
MPTHGSLTKAGKVKGQTPKVAKKERHGSIPRIKNLRNYEKRLILGRKPGQNWMTK